MKPRKRRIQKANAKKRARKHSKSAGAKQPSPKPRPKKRKGLSFEQICRRLKAKHEPMLKRFERYARWRGRRANLPESEAVALEALIRAVVMFRSRLRSQVNRLKALFHWVRRKIDFALRNLSAAHPASAVRDAFIKFEQRFGYKPTLRELCQFAGFNPRHVLNVWKQVAEELGLTPETDTIMQSLVEELADWLRPVLQNNIEGSRRIREVLARLSAADACLLILKYICGYTEEEILGLLERARDAASQFATQDELEDLLDQFVGDRIQNLAAPWDSSLLAIHSRGHLAIRLLRARARFRRL